MKIRQLIIKTAICTLPTGMNALNGQAYFNGNVSESGSGTRLRNARIMVINASDTSYFPIGTDGSYNIVTKEGKNRIYAVADGYITELNSINAAKGSVNKVDISLVKKSIVNTDPGKRAKYEASAPPARSADYEISPMEKTPYHPMRGTTTGAIAIRKHLPGLGGAIIASPGAAGRLTAGSVLDYGRWTAWGKQTNDEFAGLRNTWKINTSNRFTVQVSGSAGNPVVDAVVELYQQNKLVWTSRTDNTGKAELWGNAFLNEQSENTEKKKIYALVKAYGRVMKIEKLLPFEKGINFLKADGPCAIADQMDIAFVVDATGSMADEINYLKQDLDTFIKSITLRNKDINLRMASVFYRDKGDEYLTRSSPFSTNTTITDNFILDQKANGGGDYPEAVDEALKSAVNGLDWSSSARTRIMFLMLDAPPHLNNAQNDTLKKYLKLAAEKGIRIVPVACSGTDKVTEMLMRSFTLLTNGKYLFLTNHSGIGNSHIEPSLETYAVRSLLEEMLLVATEFSVVPDCDKFIDPSQIQYTDSLRKTENPNNQDSIRSLVLSAADSARLKDSALIRERGKNGVLTWIKFWPNPTDGEVNVKIEADIRELFIADISGKLLQRITCNKGDQVTLRLSNYSNGIYYIKYPTASGWMAERIVLRR